MPIDWDRDNDARRRLRVALTARDRKARAVDLLCEAADLDLSRIDLQGEAENIWFSVLTEAHNMGRIARLLDAATKRWPDDVALQQLAREAAPVPSSALVKQFDAPALAVSAHVVVTVMAEAPGDPRDPLQKALSDLHIADAAQWNTCFHAAMGRVAVVRTGAQGSGTGFLIGPDLVLTNWHVVKCVADSKVAASDVVVRFDYARDADGGADAFTDVRLAAEWLADHAPWSVADVTANATELPKPDELDFAVLRLARPIGSEQRGGAVRGWVALPEETKLSLGQSVLILQHPDGHPLRLAFDGVLSVNGNQTRVRYRTNTLPGASGSPCFDQNWTLLALHHAGDPRLAPLYNEGIPAAAIRALLDRRGKIKLISTDALTERDAAARRYRVVAWPMHEAEHAAVSAAMQRRGAFEGAEEGMVLGELDGEEVRALAARGIELQSFGPAVGGPVAEPDAPVAWPARFELDADLYAVIALQRDAVPGVAIVERVAEEHFLVDVRDAKTLRALLRMVGVTDVRAPRALVRHIECGLESVTPPSPWVVFLHREADRPAIVERALRHGAKVLVELGRAIRIEADAAFADEASQWPEVRRVEPYVAPELCADAFRAQIGLAQTAGVTTLPWDGRGELIAFADSGIDAGHPELEGAIATTMTFAPAGTTSDASDSRGHGTHVAGILAGRGHHHPALRGVAPGAQLHVQRVVDERGDLGWLPDDLGVLLREAYDRGARIHNDSWGASVEGRYDLRAEQMDEFVDAHRDMLIVVAAGNRGTAAKPRGVATAPIGFVEYGSIDAPAVAKNVLAVGACRSVRAEGGRAQQTWGACWQEAFPDEPVASQRISGDGDAMAAISSRGPAEESRIKPDIVAPGTDIASTWPPDVDGAAAWGLVASTDRLYRYLGGTSMAAPIVAGCAALVRQYFREARGHRPSAVLLKATLLNGARPLAGDDAMHGAPPPNFHQGFGCVDMSNTIPAPDARFALAFDDRWEDRTQWLPREGARARFRVDLDRAGELRVCIAWTDPPARGRQNNLRLMVELPDGSRRSGNAERAGRILERPGDEVNNVLSVRVPDAPAGAYFVGVTASTLLRRPQDFALVVTGPLGAETLQRLS